jgi:hypothetical protein
MTTGCSDFQIAAGHRAENPAAPKLSLGEDGTRLIDVFRTEQRSRPLWVVGAVRLGLWII